MQVRTFEIVKLLMCQNNDGSYRCYQAQFVGVICKFLNCLESADCYLLLPVDLLVVANFNNDN